MPKKRTIEDFILRARKKHGDKYDYSKAVYTGVHEKICIICPEHGEFWQEVNNHLHGAGCPDCAKIATADASRLSAEEFIAKANKVHHGRYDYSKVVYHHTDEKVCIICPEHGEFWQVPHNHLHGFGCPKCSGNYVPTTEEFIESARNIFGDKYDYSKVVYQGNKNKVCIICPEHGEFWVTPNNHLHKQGCPKCSGYYGIDRDYFIKVCTERFDGKYDYSKVEWKGYKPRVCIICPEHGEFWQSPYLHLRTLGCPKCSGSYMDKDFFIEKARIVHGDKYDYSKVKYTGNKEPVCIICPNHGEFWQQPNAHLQGHGCRKCYAEETRVRLTKSAENFLSLAEEVHQGKYDYSQMEYVDRRTPVKIICPIHGAFMQTPKSHIRGSGCPMCNNSVLEETITRLLKQHNITFIPQKTFDWLSFNGTMYLDFFLPEQGIAIECQGIQHFEAVEFWGGKEGLQQTKKRDQMKRMLCEKRGIKMLYFSNLGLKYPYEVIEDTGLLIHLITSSDLQGATFLLSEPELPLSFEE